MVLSGGWVPRLDLKRVGDVAPESRRKTQFLPNELKLLSLYCGAYNELFPEEALACGCEGDAQAVEKFENRKKREPTEERGEASLNCIHSNIYFHHRWSKKKTARGTKKDHRPSVLESLLSIKTTRRTTNKSALKVIRSLLHWPFPVEVYAHRYWNFNELIAELLTNLHFYYVPDLKCVTVKSSVKGKISCR